MFAIINTRVSVAPVNSLLSFCRMWKTAVTPTLLVCALWLVLSGTTTYYIHWLGESHARVLAENVASIRAAGLMEESLWKLQTTFANAVAQGPPGDRSMIAASEEQVERSMVAAEQAATTSDERAMVGAIRDQFIAYREFVRRHLEHAPDGVSEKARIVDDSSRLAREMATHCVELFQLNEHMLAQSVEHREQLEWKLNLARIAFLIVGPAVGIYLGFRMAQNLHRSIVQISVTLQGASGELDQEVGLVEVSSSGNPGDLSSLNQQVQGVVARIKRIMSELESVRHEAARSERLAIVGELAAGIAHELRNPLTSVKLLIQTASRRSSAIQLDEKQSHIVLEEVLRMEDSIQALLEFARPPALRRVRHDLRDTIRRALNLVEGRANHEKVKIVAPRAPSALMVDADPEQLHQVFLNVLLNAIESMSDGGEVRVSATVSAPDDRFCRVSFSDNGRGIPEEDVARVFEPFFSTKERGTGLGLATSRRIVQEHGGRMSAANREDRGTIFLVELPLAASGESPPEVTDSTAMCRSALAQAESSA